MVLYGLYSGELQRIKCGKPITTVALDPRHTSRKTKEFYYGTASGALYLSSKGWLGNSDTLLFQGTGQVHAARVAGTMLAWVTDSGVRLYDTSVHARVGKLDRPSSVIESGNSCSLVWVGDKEILVGWGRHVLALGLERSPSTNSSTIVRTSSTGIASSTPAGGTAIRDSTGIAGDGFIGTTSNVTTPNWNLQSPEHPTMIGSKQLPVSTPLTSSRGSSPSKQPPAQHAQQEQQPSASVSTISSAAMTRGLPVLSSTTTGQMHMQILTEFELEDKNETVLGVAPFGRQLAVLTRREPVSIMPPNSQGEEDAGAQQQQQQQPSMWSSTVALKVFDRSGNELFSDDIELEEYHERAQKRRNAAVAAGAGPLQQPRVSLATFFSLGDVISPGIAAMKQNSKPAFPVFWDSDLSEHVMPNAASTATGPWNSNRGSGNGAQQAEQPFKWWSDGAEPLYYVVSPDVSVTVYR